MGGSYSGKVRKQWKGALSFAMWLWSRWLGCRYQ